MSSGRFSHLFRGVWVLWLWQAVLVSSSRLWEAPTAPPRSSSNHSASLQWEPQCQYHHLQDGVRITADIPPRLDGTWVSTRCEVRPGPEFLVRSYSFHSSRVFKVLQHYYSDSSCGTPLYSLVVRGKLRLRQASWVTRGATEAQQHLHKVGMVVHSQGALQRLSARLPGLCVGQGLGLGHMVPGRVYELYSTRAGRECLGALGFSMAELGLVRVENQHYPQGGLVQELLLGDVNTDWTQRSQYRPTGYQQPLQNSMHHIHPCPVCALVFRSSEQRPPVLPRVPAAPLALDGRWVSQRCEARPAVLFLTRNFLFVTERHSWEGVYRHYSDPACQRPTFTIRAAGHYAQGGASAKVGGATEFVFKVTEVRVTVMDVAMARVLNESRRGSCGVAGGWEAGAEQEVTSTDGCTALGIKLPHKEYELFSMELDHRQRPLLFTGERPTDGSNPDRPQKRPTSYQAPMVHCGEEGNQLGRRHGNDASQVQLATGGAERLALPALGLVLASLLWGWSWVV